MVSLQKAPQCVFTRRPSQPQSQFRVTVLQCYSVFALFSVLIFLTFRFCCR